MNNIVGKEDYKDDFNRAYKELRSEWLRGKPRQSWKLVPSSSLMYVWAKYVKYGHIDEDGLEKIWDIIKINVIKIGINTKIYNGYTYDREFFTKWFNIKTADDISKDAWKKFVTFVDHANSVKDYFCQLIEY
jgi:uncharacterized protein YajQ (UPF0234 family)